MIHAEATIIDAASPLAEQPQYLELYKRGGVTAIAVEAGGFSNAGTTLRELGRWLKLLQARQDLLLVRKASDIREAKATGRLGVFFHFQGTEPIEDELDLVTAYKALGVGVIQLTYNLKNRVGDGCEERTDAGLSRFGLRLIRRMNESQVIIDCSHTGTCTTQEAIDASAHPVIISHAGASAIHSSPRNITDQQIKSIAARGGVVGAAGFPGFVSVSSRPSLQDYIRHIDHIVQQAGIDHVGLGLDYFAGQYPFASLEDFHSDYPTTTEKGTWSITGYPPPPYYYPAGIETPDLLCNLTDGLLKRGYSADDVRKIIGANWLRVFGQVWGE